MSKSTRTALIALILIACLAVGIITGFTAAFFMSKKDNTSDKKEEATELSEEIDIDTENLVIDAFNQTVSDGSLNYTYAIPKINSEKEGVAEFNRKMYDEVYALYEESVNENRTTSYYLYSDISYSWSYSDNIVSILVLINNTVAYDPEFRAYTFSFEQSKELTKEDIIELEGYSAQSFDQKVRDGVNAVSDYALQHDPNNSTQQTNDFYTQIISRTLDDEHINKAVPFYIDGQLCTVSYIFSFGGADMYRHIINLETNTDCCPFDCGLPG